MSLSDQPEGPPRKWWSMWHVLAVLLAFAVCGTVFRYTGDADVFLALGSGVGFSRVAACTPACESADRRFLDLRACPFYPQAGRQGSAASAYRVPPDRPLSRAIKRRSRP